MCNCKKYKANNLSDKDTINLIQDANNTILAVKETQDFTEADWMYLYMVYGRAYPNSKGRPSQEDLVNVLKAAASRPVAYR